jgi:hypothetical protein
LEGDDVIKLISTKDQIATERVVAIGNLAHDAAVAHALMQACEEWLPGTIGQEWVVILHRRAVEILRETFGIDEAGHD